MRKSVGMADLLLDHYDGTQSVVSVDLPLIVLSPLPSGQLRVRSGLSC